MSPTVLKLICLKEGLLSCVNIGLANTYKHNCTVLNLKRTFLKTLGQNFHKVIWHMHTFFISSQE